MKLLLDTVGFLWAAINSPRFSRTARDLVAAPEHDVFLSSVSAWEIAVKHRLGKLELPQAPQRFVPAVRQRFDIDPLPLDEEPALAVGRLPPLHADPFDRMLICQAIVHGLTILTPDQQIHQYPVRCLW